MLYQKAMCADRQAIVTRYSWFVMDKGRANLNVGLCVNCRFVRIMESDRGSKFYTCQLSATDPRFPKYPRLPVLQCIGYTSTQTPPAENSDLKQ